MVVVGAHDLRVAAGIALADGAALEHGDVAHAMILREEVRGRESVPAAADDDRVIGLLERRLMQHARPLAMTVDRMPGEGQE